MANESQDKVPEKKAGVIRRLWSKITRPSSVYSLGTLIIAGGIGGVVLWGGFNWAMEISNTEKFCISCHEMEENVFVEYKETIHYNNRSGVRATCPDCHVPKEWIHKVRRKIVASNELLHHFLGTISTPEKFDDKRLELASNVWRQMRATDSRECRNCHTLDYMDFTYQENRSAEAHQSAIDDNKTCIDCHQGVAHRLPEGAEEAYEEIIGEVAIDRPVIAAEAEIGMVGRLAHYAAGLTQ